MVFRGGGSITRFQLVELLDREGYPLAGSRILDGEDPVAVLNELRPFVELSREALVRFQAIVAGNETVRAD